jgi:hypothetical protein
MNPESGPRYLSLKDAARRYATSKSTLYIHIKRKDFRTIKHGGRRLIHVASADAFFDAMPEGELAPLALPPA